MEGDMDMMDMDMMGDAYGMEMEDQYAEMEEGAMMEEMDYGGEDESINFENDPNYAHMKPLDRMRKIRRAIMKTIGDLREAHGSASIYTDASMNQAANEYAGYLLENQVESSDKLDEICKANNICGGVPECIVGYGILEEDEDHQGTLHDQMMDAHGLLLELDQESTQLGDKKNTHVGIGFAFNKEKVKVVELIQEKPFMINQVGQSEDGGVDIRGVMLNKEIGLYAASVVSTQKIDKDIKAVDPTNIQYDKGTGEFMIQIPGPIDDLFYGQEEKLIKFFIRRTQVDKIQYGQDTGERVNTKGMECAMMLPTEFYPDPRTIIEDQADMERESRDREIRRQQQEKEAQIKQAEKVARQAEREKKIQQFKEINAGKGDDDSQDVSADSKSKSRTPGQKDSQDSQQEGDEDSQGEMSGSDDAFEEDSDEDSEDIAALPSQDEMKKDLIQAIQEELNEQEMLRRENEELQKSIIAIEPNYDTQDKQTDGPMNEHKYLNTLANVHQVRINLKETQDRYNKMASELQAKLNEKQAKCSEIETQFKELKRSVAANAVFSRTGKKIPKKTLEEWEESEALKDQEVHQYRLQNIALRNRLANKEKILKKREQLADGLHLIDFEQLKIENQTLNEKIEERNEELHKLRKKITQNVVQLSHTREKLQYVIAQNQIQNTKLEDLKEQLNAEKSEQSKLKKYKEKLQKINLKLKQQTGIVNKKELQTDYEDRGVKITQLQEKIKMLMNKHHMLQQVIEQASEFQLKKMGT